MKNPNKKMMMVMCAVLLAQSGTTIFGMQRARGAVQAARSKWQTLRGNIGQLQEKLACINTNSCTPDQQAYIKSMVKKLAVGIAAAAAACGLYAVVKSKQYEGLKEDIAAVRNLALSFNVTGEHSITVLMAVKEFADAVRRRDESAVSERYNNIVGMKDIFGKNAPRNIYNAANFILNKYAKDDPRSTQLPPMAEKLRTYIGGVVDIARLAQKK